jgi:nucleoside-diphosphate-sugar epimerase
VKRTLVTGGSGFLGGWCLVELLRRGYAARTTVRNLAREPQVRAMIGSQVEAGDRLSVLQADLTSDAGWQQAVDGCDFVLHIASPFPSSQPKDPDELIVPAREGTLRVLRAALEAGAERVVVTSSVAAIRGGGPQDRPLTEDDWSNPDNTDLTPYARSKTIAERAAWDLVGERGEAERLAAVNPGAIIGPVLGDDRSYSLQSIGRLLEGTPGVPRLGFSFVDVRDVADLQIAAMTAEAAGAERFIATAGFRWLSEVAEVLRANLGDDAAEVPTRKVPDLLVRALAVFDSELRSVTGDLGKKAVYSNEKARSVLGWTPRPIEESIVDCARSLIGKPRATYNRSQRRRSSVGRALHS